MSTESQDFRCLTIPYNLSSQAKALMSSYDGATVCFPALPLPQSPKSSPDMSSVGHTMLELYDSGEFLSSLYPVSGDSLTIAPRDIFTKHEASGQMVESHEEKIQHHISDSTDFQCPYTAECSYMSTADPFADGLVDVQIRGPKEDRNILPPGFECRYEGCHGKDGKRKVYARAEHRNRHERTLHRKTENALYRCWVRDCRSKGFTRVDNLKAHLMVRHGRKSRAGRYQYIATLDRSSSYYNPEWMGSVTSDGIPT